MRKAVLADIPALCAVYFSAFSDTMIGRQVFPPDSEAALVFWTESLTEDLEDANLEIFVMTTRSEDDSDEVIVGYAKWVRPGTPVEMPSPAEAWPQDGNPALAVEFFGGLAAAHQRMMDGQPHWYLELIGVRKEWMGKGAASPLMRWGVSRADEDGLPCFLEATPNGRGMYEKYGFRVVGQQEFELPILRTKAKISLESSRLCPGSLVASVLRRENWQCLFQEVVGRLGVSWLGVSSRQSSMAP